MIGDAKSTGAIVIDGVRLGRRSPSICARRGLLLVPEDRKIAGLSLSSSVQSNIEASALGGALSRLGIVRRSERRKFVDELIRRFHIYPADRAKPVGLLSGGNAQKVLLARAMATRPKVLVLDQPTAGVDIGAKAELHRLIGAAAADGVGVIVISDDLDELLNLSDRLVVMTDGALGMPVERSSLNRAALLAAISRRAAAQAAAG